MIAVFLMGCVSALPDPPTVTPSAIPTSTYTPQPTDTSTPTSTPTLSATPTRTPIPLEYLFVNPQIHIPGTLPEEVVAKLGLVERADLTFSSNEHGEGEEIIRRAAIVALALKYGINPGELTNEEIVTRLLKNPDAVPIRNINLIIEEPYRDVSELQQYYDRGFDTADYTAIGNPAFQSETSVVNVDGQLLQDLNIRVAFWSNDPYFYRRDPETVARIMGNLISNGLTSGLADFASGGMDEAGTETFYSYRTELDDIMYTKEDLGGGMYQLTNNPMTAEVWLSP